MSLLIGALLPSRLASYAAIYGVVSASPARAAETFFRPPHSATIPKNRQKTHRSHRRYQRPGSRPAEVGLARLCRRRTAGWATAKAKTQAAAVLGPDAPGPLPPAGLQDEPALPKEPTVATEGSYHQSPSYFSQQGGSGDTHTTHPYNSYYQEWEEVDPFEHWSDYGGSFYDYLAQAPDGSPALAGTPDVVGTSPFKMLAERGNSVFSITITPVAGEGTQGGEILLCQAPVNIFLNESQRALEYPLPWSKFPGSAGTGPGTSLWDGLWGSNPTETRPSGVEGWRTWTKAQQDEFLKAFQTGAWWEEIKKAAAKYNLPPELLNAVIIAELIPESVTFPSLIL